LKMTNWCSKSRCRCKAKWSGSKPGHFALPGLILS